MKMTLTVLFVFLLLQVASAEHQEVDLTIFGMDCAVCAHSLRVSLRDVDGVESVDVSINQGVAKVALKHGNQVTLDRLRQVVKSIGFLPRDAVVRSAGTLEFQSGKPVFRVSGLSESYDVDIAPEAKQNLIDLNAWAGQPLILNGSIHTEGKQPSSHVVVSSLSKP